MSAQEKREYDVVVIGGGPGGYPAAIRAGQLGLRTALIERGDLGGICLNQGCIPTKALLHGAELLRAIRAAPAFGIEVPAPSVDVEQLVEHSRQVSAQLAGGVESLLRANTVEVIRGEAVWAERGELSVTLNAGERKGSEIVVEAEHIVLATGASPRSLPGIEPDGDRVWTYREALRPTEIPESLVVIGSGAIGSEFASLYADLGTRVTLLEALPRILPGESEEASAYMARQFARRGIEARAGARVGSVTPGPEGVEVVYEDAEGEHRLTVSRVLVAVGVAANTQGLGLENLGILRRDGSVQTDGLGRTSVWGLYAVGDVAGPPCLAHKATHEAIECIEALAGVARVPRPEDWADWVPKCTYTFPEVASIGLNAQRAAEAGHDVVSGRAEMASNGRALGTGETEGWAEVFLDRNSGAILGAQVIGAGATETISLVAVAHAGGMDARTFAHAMIPHPSRAEALHEALLNALGTPINTL